MTNYKIIKGNENNESTDKSNTNNPAKIKGRHKPVKGLPRV